MKIFRKFLLVFTTIILVTMIVSGVTWTNISVAENNQTWSMHSLEVIDTADTVLTSLLNQETGVRGYLLTNEPAFLEPYDQGRAEFEHGLAHLTALTADNDIQQGRIAEFSSVARDWQQTYAAKQIEFVSQPGGGDTAAAHAIGPSKFGKAQMDRARGIMKEIRDAEFEALATRTASTEQAFVSTKMATLIGMVLLVALASVSAGGLARGISRPIGALTATMSRLTTGDRSEAVAGNERGDEIGDMARTFEIMRGRLADEVHERLGAEAMTRQLNVELEDKVRLRTADLAAANQELGAFAYSISHDLRAPLRAIDGFGGKLERGYAQTLDAEGRRLLQVMRDNARRMGQLIDDLLAFSRLGRREMSVAPVDMAGLVRSVADELCAAEPPTRTIEIKIGTIPPASGDMPMLRQVWINLLSNAIKFTRTRTPACIDVGGEVIGSEIRYWVKDNGVGFDMLYADKLFGVFQRLHAPDEFEGTGVGLALSQRIIHRHGGHIQAQSVLDQGTTFSFVLPALAPTNTEETLS